MQNKIVPFIATTGITVFCGALAFCLITGCNSEDYEPLQNATLTITPQVVEIKTNQTVEFMASGGILYNWSVSNQATRWAIFSAYSGEKIRYTSIKAPNSGRHLEVLTCTSTIGGTSTNSSGLNISAEAYIWHIK